MAHWPLPLVQNRGSGVPKAVGRRNRFMKLTCERMTLKLAVPFRTARAVRTDKETLWVKVTHDGVEGWGEAAPVDTYHQTLESSERTVLEAARFVGGSPFETERLTEALLARFGEQCAAVAAIDAALHDWIGKRVNLPIWKYLGLAQGPLPLTSYSLGIEEDLSSLAERVRSAAKYPVLKVKLGSPRDEEIIRLVRCEAPRQRIRVDANMGWTIDTALRLLPLFAELGVEFVEQPLAAHDLDGLRRLKEAAILPIVADESCVRREDVLKVRGCVDGINIKLSKCGGIRQALTMIRLGRACGLKIMLGCMIESSLGISAALQLATLADWLDLDGHLLVSPDPFGGIGGGEGKLHLSDRPGLGVMPMLSS